MAPGRPGAAGSLGEPANIPASGTALSGTQSSRVHGDGYLSFEGILDTAKETNQKLIGQRKTIILGEIANCAGTQNFVEDVQIQLLEWRLIIHIIHS